MKTTANYLLGAACAAALASCYSYQPPPQQPQGPSLDNAPGQSRYWNGPVEDPNAPGAAPTDPAAIAAPNPPVIDPNAPPGSVPANPGGSYQPSPPSTGGSNATVGVPTQPQQPPVQPTNPTPAPPPTVPSQTKPSSLPVGIKVNGKPGFVYSPYDKTAGIVDVQGMAPGTKVKCPYTGKVFIVP